MNDINDEVEYLRELSKLLSVRTCEEMHDYGVNKSDYYLVDPDGPLNGEEPIRVYCDFTKDYGFTRISHNSEEKMEVKCDECGKDIDRKSLVQGVSFNWYPPKNHKFFR